MEHSIGCGPSGSQTTVGQHQQRPHKPEVFQKKRYEAVFAAFLVGDVLGQFGMFYAIWMPASHLAALGVSGRQGWTIAT